MGFERVTNKMNVGHQHVLPLDLADGWVKLGLRYCKKANFKKYLYFSLVNCKGRKREADRQRKVAQGKRRKEEIPPG